MVVVETKEAQGLRRAERRTLYELSSAHCFEQSSWADAGCVSKLDGNIALTALDSADVVAMQVRQLIKSNRETFSFSPALDCI